MTCLWACSHICHLSISETTIVFLVCAFQDSRFFTYLPRGHTSCMLSAIYHVNLQITLKWEKCSRNPLYQNICALQDSRFFTIKCHTSRILSAIHISCESSDYSQGIKIFHKSTMSKQRKYYKGPNWMAWNEDQINEFSKPEDDVLTDNNFVIDHTSPFLDTRFSRLDNNCNW